MNNSISSSTRVTPPSRLLALFYFAIAGAYCVLFLISDHAYLQDYPGWVYEGVVLYKKLLGDLALPYTFKTYPVPNSTITILIAALSPLGFNAAAKLAIVGYIATSSYLVLKLCHQVDPIFAVEKAWVVMSTVFISSCFWNGYINYQTGLLLLVAYALAENSTVKPSRVRLLLFSIVIFFTHFVPFAALCLYALYRAYRSRSAGYLWPLVPSFIFTCWYAIGRLTSISEHYQVQAPLVPGAISFAAYKAYTLLKLGPFQNFILPDGSSYLEKYTALYWAFITTSLLFLGLIAVELVRDTWRSGHGRGSYEKPALALAVLAAFLVTPSALLGIVNFGERIIIPAFAAAIVWTAFRRSTLAVLSVIALCFCIYNFKFMYDVRHIEPQNWTSQGIQTDGATSPQVAPSIPGASANIESLYLKTKQKYLNHRLFEKVRYYRAIEECRYSLPLLGTGVMDDLLLRTPQNDGRQGESK